MVQSKNKGRPKRFRITNQLIFILFLACLVFPQYVAVAQSQTKPALAPKLTLVEHSVPGVLTIKKPQGWSFYKTGEYDTLAILTQDEQEPLRQVFLFSNIGLFYTSQDQKDLELSYQKSRGYSIPWIDMPILSPLDGTSFFLSFQHIMNSMIGRAFLAQGKMPMPAGFDDPIIISQQEIDPVVLNLPAYLIRAILTRGNEAAQRMFVVTPVQDGFGHGSALIVAGITAPVREYYSVQPDLIAILNSLQLEPSYVEDGVRVIGENGEVYRQISKTLSETSDVIIQGHQKRSKVDDLQIEKEGDKIKGLERVYDPDTGEVYEVVNGFYDHYDTHRGDYKKNNLKLLPTDDYQLWNVAPLINHGYILP